MRAFRPSSFAPTDEYEEDEQQQRDENVLCYRERAEARLPLFDSPLPSLAEMLRDVPLAK